MYRVPREATRGLRFGISALAAVVALLAVTADPADARGHRKRHAHKKPQAAQTYSPRYADIVVDAKSGVSGAGKTPSERTHFSEFYGSLSAYGVFSHRHGAEIEQGVGRQAASRGGMFDAIGVHDFFRHGVTRCRA